MKICSRCKFEKAFVEFSGKETRCKSCNKERTRLWRINNPEKNRDLQVRQNNKRSPEKNREYARLWREKNPEKSRELTKSWFENNRERQRELAKRWRDRNPEKCRQIKNNWRKNSGPAQEAAKLSNYYRVRVRQALHGLSKAAPTLEMLGCSIPEFRQHIESQFRPGMTWENYGPVWHIDHIKSCSKFDLSDPEQQKACFHWSNTQPLFADENLHKGANK